MTDQSFYDIKDAQDLRRQKADLLYKCFMDKDTTALDTCIKDIRDLTVAEFPNASDNLRRMFDKCIESESRVAKHGALLFGLYLTPQYANKLVTEGKMDAERFRHFYMHHLPDMCQKHLGGKPKFDSYQAFVEEARTRYMIL